MNASTRAAPIVPLSLPVLPIATAAPSHADAELLRLYGELKTAWATERAIISAGGDDDEVNAAIDISSTIVDKICKCHAVTMEGIRVKASAVHCGATAAICPSGSWMTTSGAQTSRWRSRSSTT
jgi:hypothetical protein